MRSSISKLMTRTSSHAVNFGLMGLGLVLWPLAGRSAIASPDLKVPLNPLGINGSPYGEVFAMAMQGPIDTYANVGILGERTNAKIKPIIPPTKQGFNAWINSLSQGVAIRTNPHSTGEALKRHSRRLAENKLRFAYQLDPSHYGNYNTLHFFLAEPAFGNHSGLTPATAKLAAETIQYCLKQENDPRPALTAAGAATNVMDLMFANKSNFSTHQMRDCLKTLDICIERYKTLAKKWDDSKNWSLLSPDRIIECEDRFSFIGKIRDSAEQAIIRLEETQSKKN
jgi:hypothetical protein